ncbi:MAG: Rne/Rng family ribonuclease [Paracoccaceae bacterium]
MLIDATHPEETRVVVLDGNKVDDFDFESINKRQLAGNIYLAKVTRVEPSLQAAFVDYGGNRHGFLAFSEIHPDYYQIPAADREALIEEEERAQRAQAREEEGADLAEAPKRPRRSRKSADGSESSGTRSRSRSARGSGADASGQPAETSAQPAPPQPATQSGDEGDESADASAKRNRRGRKRTSGRSETRGQAASGLEVIDLGDETETSAETPGPVESPKGLEVTDVAEAGTDALPAPGQDAPIPAPTPQSIEAADAESAEALEPSSVAPAEPVSAEAAEPVSAEAAEPVSAQAEGAAPDAAAPDLAPDGPAPKSDAETAPEPAPETAVETASETAPEPAAETATETASEPGPNDTPTGPKSVAESAGLGEERVTGDIAERDDAAGDDMPDGSSDDADGEARDGAKGRGRSRGGRRRTAKAKTEPDEDTPAEAPEVLEPTGAEDVREDVVRDTFIRKRRYKIQDVIKVRQILLVQVVKEERGNKGAALTTYLSLAGRYGVLMPNTARGGGISRKITNAVDRKRLREIVDALDVPQGMGLIVRTAGAERTRPEIRRDYEFLLRQWEQIRELTLRSIAPCLIYEEGSLIKRSIRDIYSKDIEVVLVEGDDGYREAKDYMKMLMPSHAKNVKQYAESVPLFIRYQVESYLNSMFSPVVQLRSGGYIVIGITEALVAIDVNSGRSTKEGSVEDTALKTNLEAADEVARQLRLRDLAGLIVIDFIDMDEGRNNRSVEKRMKERLKADRARIQIGRISAFGLMEMSRQRLRPGMLEASTKPCPHCHGTGAIRSDDSLSLAILREVEEEGVRERSAEITVTAPIDIANYLINRKRAHLLRIEERHRLRINIFGDPLLISPDYQVQRSKAAAPVHEHDATVITAESAARGAEAEPAATPAKAPDGRSERRADSRSEARAPEGRETRAKAPVEPKAEAQAESAGQARRDDEDETNGTDADGKARRRRGKRGGRRRRGRGPAEEAESAGALGSGPDAGDLSEESAADEAPRPSSEEPASDEPAVDAPDAQGDRTPGSEAATTTDVGATDVAATDAAATEGAEVPAPTDEAVPSADASSAAEPSETEAKPRRKTTRSAPRRSRSKKAEVAAETVAVETGAEGTGPDGISEDGTGADPTGTDPTGAHMPEPSAPAEPQSPPEAVAVAGETAPSAAGPTADAPSAEAAATPSEPPSDVLPESVPEPAPEAGSQVSDIVDESDQVTEANGAARTGEGDPSDPPTGHSSASQPSTATELSDEKKSKRRGWWNFGF